MNYRANASGVIRVITKVVGGRGVYMHHSCSAPRRER